MKIRTFYPGNAALPAIPVVEITDDMHVLGRIRMPKGITRGVMVDAPMLYQCEEKNINSAKTARKAGCVEKWD